MNNQIISNKTRIIINKLFINISVVSLITIPVTYLLSSYVFLTFNFTLWDETWRSTSAFIIGTIIFFTGVFTIVSQIED